MTSGSTREHICDLSVAHSEGERLLHCDVTAPLEQTRGTLVIAHGFKGYKDYGMFPHLARTVASHGWSVVRFNFAHSGMTRCDETFERPDLFALDTWNRQVLDLEQLLVAIRAGGLPSCSQVEPVVLFGHSRGGMASILAAGRGLEVDAVVSASSPGAAIRFSEDDLTRLRQDGVCPVESSRTGQMLSVGRHFLDEVERDPERHDPCLMAARIRCPLVLVHGDSDQTVPCEDAMALAAASGGRVELVPGGDHVFNVPNPFDPDHEASPQLAALESVLLETLKTVQRGP